MNPEQYQASPGRSPNEAAMGDDVQEPAAEEVVTDVVPPTPTPPSPPSLVIPYLPPHQPPCPPQPQDTEAAQQLEIVKLKARVKKLEKINKVKSSKLRRLKKVGTSQRVESSDDMENVFNQGRIIADTDQDEGIELVADQEKDAEFKGRHADKQAEIYNIDLDHSSKVVPASIPIPAAKPKILTITAAPASREEMEAEDEEIIKSINETPAQKAAKRRKLHEQAKEDEDLKKQLEVVEDEDDDVFIEATPIGRKTMFEKTDGQDAIWRNQQSVYGQALVKIEKRYLLSKFTLEQLVNVVRLKVEEESDMSLELLRFTRQQLQEYQQGNVDAASLKLKLFKDVAAVADAK
nr:hypothetical protein [Tanacetum cinerariifolium]